MVKKDDTPLISVVIVCYNYANFVTDAIKSVLAQSYKNVEIIVINDGSTDDSDTVIQQLVESNPAITYIEKANEGIALTRNRAVKEASGDYIIQLDADDMIPPEYVELLVKEIDGSDIYYTKAIEPTSQVVRVNGEDFDIERLKLRNFMHASSMYKLMTIRKYSYDGELNRLGLEDWDFHLAMCLDGAKGKLVDTTFLYYRDHSSSRSTEARSNLSNVEAVNYILRKYVNLYPEQMKNVAWLSRNIDKLVYEAVRIKDKNTQLEAEIYDERKEVQKYRSEARRLASLLSELKSSKSYRIGRSALAAPRASKSMLGKVKHSLQIKRREKMLLSHINDVYGLFNTSPSANKVDIVIRSYYHPTSSTFIRLISPLSQTVFKGRLNIKLIDGEKMNVRPDAEVVIVQRTAVPDVDEAKRLVQSISKSGARLFVDTDDAFGDLDPTHPQYDLQKQRSEALDYVIGHAEEVWVSTPKLEQNYVDIAKRTKVVYNTIDRNVWSRYAQKKVDHVEPGSILKMIYMGTATHSGDFAMILPALEALHEKYPGQFQLTVVGVATNLENSYPWIEVRKPTSALYPDFIDWLNQQEQFDVGLSPLENSNFNQSKSDIKCLDYLACGIHPVVSDVEPYANSELDGLITRVSNTKDAWLKELESIIEHKKEYRLHRESHVLKGYEYIEKKRQADQAAKAIKVSLDRKTDAQKNGKKTTK